MRGDAGDVEVELADTLAGGLVGEALGRFEDEDGFRLQGEALGDGTGDGAADLFVAIEQEGGWTADAELREGFEGGEGHEDAGLHVEDTWSVEASVTLVKGHGGERAEGPDGVEMAEEEDGLAGIVSRQDIREEVELEDVAVGSLAVAGDDGIERRGERGEGVGSRVDGGGRVGGRLDEDQCFEAFEEPGEEGFDSLE